MMHLLTSPGQSGELLGLRLGPILGGAGASDIYLTGRHSVPTLWMAYSHSSKMGVMRKERA